MERAVVKISTMVQLVSLAYATNQALQDVTKLVSAFAIVVLREKLVMHAKISIMIKMVIASLANAPHQML